MDIPAADILEVRPPRWGEDWEPVCPVPCAQLLALRDRAFGEPRGEAASSRTFPAGPFSSCDRKGLLPTHLLGQAWGRGQSQWEEGLWCGAQRDQRQPSLPLTSSPLRKRPHASRDTERLCVRIPIQCLSPVLCLPKCPSKYLGDLEQKESVLGLDLRRQAGPRGLGETRACGTLPGAAFCSPMPGPQAWLPTSKATSASPPAAVGCQPVPAGCPAETLRDPVLSDPQRGECREHLQVCQGERHAACCLPGAPLLWGLSCSCLGKDWTGVSSAPRSWGGGLPRLGGLGQRAKLPRVRSLP